MRGSRNRRVWRCHACHNRKLYSRKAWASHLWDAHHLALPIKVRINKETTTDANGRAP